MAIETITTTTIKVTNLGAVELKTTTTTTDGTLPLGKTIHYRCIYPGDDYSQESDDVKNACALYHTPECIAAYQALKAASQRVFVV